MFETLFLSYSKRLEPTASIAIAALKEKGYATELLSGSPKDGSLVLLFLDMESTEGEIYAAAPWLKEQFEYSSLLALRLMPFLLYRSSKGSVEDQVEESLADTLESVISGEFKPYGFDLDAKEPLAEFESVLEGYEE